MMMELTSYIVTRRRLDYEMTFELTPLDEFITRRKKFGAKRALYMRTWRIIGNNRSRTNTSRRIRKRADPRRFLLNKAKERAKKKKLAFSITVEDLCVVEKCPVLGIAIRYDLERVSSNSPTIDRIDNSRGYISGNVQIISFRANSLKSDATIEELQLVIEHMKRTCSM